MNQRWQIIADLSSGPVHGGQAVAEPESVRLPFITQPCLCGALETSHPSVAVCTSDKLPLGLSFLIQPKLLNRHSGMFQS